MKLARFAILQLGGDPGPWRAFSSQHEATTVYRMHDWKKTGPLHRQLLLAETDLAALPPRDPTGCVQVPEAERRAAEHALEQTADAISVATGHPRSLRSPSLTVAFRAEDDEERAWLTECVTLDRFDRTVSVPRFTVTLREADLGATADRADGLQILAEALAQEHPAGCFRELLRVFERAFHRRGRGLVPALSAFLAQRPGLSYSREEVATWIVGMRGQTTHASDNDTFYVAADLRPYLARLKLAAYEVLLNKKNWWEGGTARRDAWTPSAGPLDADGQWFMVVNETEPPLVSELFDAYGAYPREFNSEFDLSIDESCWPRSGPQTTTSDEARFHVIERDTLALAQSQGS